MQGRWAYGGGCVPLGGAGVQHGMRVASDMGCTGGGEFPARGVLWAVRGCRSLAPRWGGGSGMHAAAERRAPDMGRAAGCAGTRVCGATTRGLGGHAAGCAGMWELGATMGGAGALRVVRGAPGGRVPGAAGGVGDVEGV